MQRGARIGSQGDTLTDTTPFRVLIAGAGVAAFEAALALRAQARDLVSVELVAPDNEFTYRPLAVAEPFRVGEVRRFPLEPLVGGAGATLRNARVESVEPELKRVTLDGGEALDFDAFLVALGARAREAIVGALTFRGPEDGAAMADLLEQATAGDIQRIAFVVPAGGNWPLPVYELALLTATYLTDRGTRGVEILLVTPEERPLGLFGAQASDAIRELLEIRGVAIEAGAAAHAWSDGLLHVAGRPPIDVDAAVALPQLLGPALPGLPHDGAGFVPTDTEGRVPGTSDVYAAGDATQFRPKQGGLAAQQADAVAAAIAARVGVAIKPRPFRPVLRGLLLTGGVPRYLRTEMTGGRGETSTVASEPLWWPAGKIVGRYLAPFLADRVGVTAAFEPADPTSAVAVDVELAR
jgi:sulfide:quinone oxidoreductase